MATQNGVNYAKKINPTTANILGAAESNGKVRVMHDSFTFAGEAAGEVIRIGKLPKNSRYLGAIIANAALGAAVTVQIGDSGDDDRFVAAVDANTTPPIGIAKTPQTGMNYEFSDETIILLKTAGGAATGLIEVALLYSVE